MKEESNRRLRCCCRTLIDDGTIIQTERMIVTSGKLSILISQYSTEEKTDQTRRTRQHTGVVFPRQITCSLDEERERERTNEREKNEDDDAARLFRSIDRTKVNA